MPAGRMAGDVEPVLVAAELLRVVVDPGDGRAHLLGHGHQVAADVVDIVEVDDHAVRAGVDDHLGEHREIGRAAVPPGAAVDVDVDRRVRGIFLAAIDVDALDLARAILEALRRAEPRLGARIGGGAARMHQRLVRRIDRLVIGVVELGLVHAHPDDRALGFAVVGAHFGHCHGTGLLPCWPRCSTDVNYSSCPSDWTLTFPYTPKKVQGMSGDENVNGFTGPSTYSGQLSAE